MSFLAEVLEKPSYGFERNGELYVPSKREILREFVSRLNVFANRKNWITAFAWLIPVLILIPTYYFFFHYFSWTVMALGFCYSMILMGTHGTIYFHRYATHRAFQFRHPFFRFFVRHMVIKVFPEESYVISHYVHHAYSEQPGDPYNVNGGWLYCFLADANHQPIARDLSPADYTRLTKLLDHCGIKLNSYAQYKRWGSLCHPAWTLLHFGGNWLFWCTAFYLIGGPSLLTGLLFWAGVWAIGIRTYNYDGHGGGVDKRQDGIDFNRADLSINQIWPGVVTGEWHNNHHLYPNGARAGFLPYQFDTAWVFIRFYSAIGGISSYRDFKEDFMKKHYSPYAMKKNAELVPAPMSVGQAHLEG